MTKAADVAARHTGGSSMLIQDCDVIDYRRRRPQWLSERQAILVNLPRSVAEALRDRARKSGESVSAYAARRLADAIDIPRPGPGSR